MDDCSFDSKESISNYLIYVVSPVLLVKALGLILYRNRYSEEFKDSYRRIQYFMHVTWGTWTLFNISHIYNRLPE